MKKVTLALTLVLLSVLNVQSQWTNNVGLNSATCDTTGEQATPKIASTSDGGCYIMWFDNRSGNYSVYLQKYDAAGYKLFPDKGLLVSSHTQSSSLQDFNIDVDASDNAVLVFTDRRNGTILNPFAYLISPTGAFLWGPDGVSLTDSTGISQNIPVVAATSDGHYVFAWTYGSSPTRIAMQRLNAAGVPQWGSNPIKLRGTGSEHFNFMRIVKSDAGSVIMNWDAYTGNLVTTSTIKIFIQKFSPTGSIMWSNPQDTIQNLGRVSGIGFIPYLVSDGQNGAVITWVDDRDANSRQSVWTQRINSSGVIQFPKNGSEGTTDAVDNHFSPTVTFLPQTNETVMFWHETNGGQTVQGGLYGQKFDAAGNRQWSDNGKEFKAMDNNQLSFLSAYSKDTNVVVCYTESLFGSGNALVKATRTGPSGEFHWSGNIVTVSSVLSAKIRKQSVTDKNNGQTVATWSDNRSGTGDIYSQNIKLNGDAGVCLLNLTAGIEGFWDGVSQVQDTMRVNLRSNISPYGQIDQSKVYLNSAGSATAGFLSAPNGSYYIQLIHRNALETWSASDIGINKSSVANHDFTTSQAQTFGNNSVLVSGRYCCFSGEVIKDGAIDLSDIVAIFNDASVFASGYIVTDVNGDSLADLTDMVIAFNNSAAFVTVMKP